MKKHLFLLMCIIPLLSHAQPIMTYDSHGLKPNTANIMRLVEFASPGDAGTQVVWDFKHALPVQGHPDNKESLTQDGSRNILVTNPQGVKFSHTCNYQANIYNGFYADNHSIIFDQPIKKVVYPFTYGDKLSGIFSGRIAYQGSNMEFSRTGTYSTEADAVGTLVMPSGQVLEKVLRLKTVEKFIDQLCSSVEVEFVKYLWYIEEYRYPVFVISDMIYNYPNKEAVVKRKAYVTTANLYQAKDQPIYESEVQDVNMNDKQIDVEHTVYPNPYNELLHIVYTLNKPTTVNISLYSLSGILVNEIVRDKVQNGAQHIHYTPRHNERTGTYYLRLQFDDKVYVRALIKN